MATYENDLGTPTTFFPETDWLGTERVQTDVSGAACETITSLPFGDGLNTVGSCDPSALYFTGKLRDWESNLDNFGARYFSSQMGRMMSPDPLTWLRWQHGTSSDQERFESWISDPQDLNLFSYVDNNPLSRTDPSGMYICSGNKGQCTQVHNALKLIRKAASNLKSGSFERKRLESVLKFYGKEGEQNGVGVKFADLGGSAYGVTSTENKITTITFDTSAMKRDFGPVGSAETIAHEGTHGLDQRSRGVGAGLFWSLYDTEYHAYQSELYVDMGLGVRTESDGDRPGWALGMPYFQHVLNITRNAYANALADCNNECGP